MITTHLFLEGLLGWKLVMTALPFLVLKLVVLYVYMSSLFPTRDDAALKPHDGEQLKNVEIIVFGFRLEALRQCLLAETK